MTRRITRSNAVRVGIVLALAVTAAVVANVVLLGVATGRSEPVGKLSPRGGIVATAPLPPTGTDGDQGSPDDD